MQKFIFGCVLMLCGMIGGTGWLIASASLNLNSQWISVVDLFWYSGIDGFIALCFYVIAAAGLWIALTSMDQETNKQNKITNGSGE